MRPVMKNKQNVASAFGARSTAGTSAFGAAKSFAATLGRRFAEGGVRVGKEVEANFRAWFERNFVSRRAGRIGHVSYSRAGFLDDRPGDGMWYSEALGRAWADYNAPLTASEMGYMTSHPLIAFQLAAGITDVRGLRCMIRGLTQRTNRLQQKAYRSRYYGRDNARRRMLAAERRKTTRRTTTNPCPTPDDFRKAFAGVKESVEAKLFFGGMVRDLACYVDSCLRYDETGNIVGRNGGIKEWMAENVPELYPRYKIIMRYKALVVRLRQAMDMKDPEPTSALLEETCQAVSDETCYAPPGETSCALGETRATMEKDTSSVQGYDVFAAQVEDMRSGQREERKARGDKNYYASNSHNGKRRAMKRHVGRGVRLCGIDEDARKTWGSGLNSMCQRKERLRRLLDRCENTFKDVFDRIDAALGDLREDSSRGV